MRNMFKWCLAATLIATLGLVGCSGNDGAVGPTGATGATGATGPVTTTGESCAVCHGAGAVADLAGSMGPNVAADNNFNVDATQTLPQLTVTNVSTTASVDATPTLNIVTTFTVQNDAALQAFLGAAVSDTAGTGLESTNHAGARLAYLSIAYAQLQSQATTTPQWVNLTHGDKTPADLTVVPDGSGNLVCTMTTALTGDAVTNFQAATRTRTLIILSGSAATGPNDVIFDFMPNGAATLAPSRDVVAESACNSCHGNLGGNGFAVAENLANSLGLDFPKQHGGNYYKIEACVVCHTDSANATTATGGVHGARVIQTLIHQIHQEIDQTPLFADRFDDWSQVTYPDHTDNGAIDCTLCHTANADATFQADYPYGNGADGSNYKGAPTAAACGTCHADVLDANTNPATAHPGGQQANSACATCHPASGSGYGQSVTTAHSPNPRLITTDSTGATVHEDNRSEFIPHIAITAPANGQYYVAGEAPEVTVTLTVANADGTDSGTAVDPSVYATPSTDATSAKGVAGGGLSSAVLMVYGPRANALPVLTTGSTTDPNLAAGAKPEQEHSLLLPTTDASVSADANGFHYQLQAIPASLAAGTYMVQFQGADYGGLSNTDYVTGSTGLINIQVGTATVEAKVDGNGCVNCHNTTHMHVGGKYAHNVPFNTDYCQACHDQSGNHGDPIANRVHAVHDANTMGDLANYSNGAYAGASRNWDDVTFPQNDQKCAMCHTADGSGTYLTKPYEMPCFGCHADGTGVIDHMQQNGGKLP